jgi:hypothetical protein
LTRLKNPKKDNKLIYWVNRFFSYLQYGIKTQLNYLKDNKIKYTPKIYFKDGSWDWARFPKTYEMNDEFKKVFAFHNDLKEFYTLSYFRKPGSATQEFIENFKKVCFAE